MQWLHMLRVLCPTAIGTAQHSSRPKCPPAPSHLGPQSSSAGVVGWGGKGINSCSAAKSSLGAAGLENVMLISEVEVVCVFKW